MSNLQMSRSAFPKVTSRRSQILKNTQFYFITELFSSCNTRNILLAAAVLPYKHTDSMEVQTNVCFLQTYGWCYEYCVHVKQTLKKQNKNHQKATKKCKEHITLTGQKAFNSPNITNRARVLKIDKKQGMHDTARYISGR